MLHLTKKTIVFLLLLIVSDIGEAKYCSCSVSISEVTWKCANEIKKLLILNCKDCSDVSISNASIYDFLPQINSSVGFFQLQFEFCPMPNGPLKAFLTKFKSTLVLNALVINNSPSNLSTLNSSYFQDLPLLNHLRIENNANLTKLNADVFSGSPDLLDIYLRNNFISEIDPKLFQNLPNLQQLYLSDNHISEIDPKVFQNLPNLQKLYLSNNHIAYLDPGIFRNLSSLMFLAIDNNPIVNLTRALFSNLPHLYFLDISGCNNISVLSSEVFDDLGKLNTFRAHENKFVTFPQDLFSKTKSLETIEIKNSTLKELPSGLFSNLPELHEVVLDGSSIQEVPVDLFSNSPKLAELQLRGHKKIKIPKDLFKDNLLYYLDLSGNNLRDIPEALNGQYKLKALILENNLIEKITESNLKNLGSLEMLVLRFNGLKQVDSLAFDSLTSLRKLDLSNNLLQHYPPFSSSKLLDIDLSNNFIHRFKFDNLEEMTFPIVKENDELSIFEVIELVRINLDLSSNNITTVDFSFLEEMVKLRKNSSHLENRKFVMILDNNPLCNYCTNYGLIQYLNNKTFEDDSLMMAIQVSSVKCEGNVTIKSILPERISCDIEMCPTSCTCNYMPYFSEMRVNCSSANLTEMPHFLPATYEDKKVARIQLILRNNSIQHMLEKPPKEYELVTELDMSLNRFSDVSNMKPYLNNLEKLDLSHNDLKAVSQDFLTNVSKKLHSLALFGNPWSCDCNIEPLLSFVKTSSILSDAENITCKGWEKPLEKMILEDFCST